MTLLVSFAIRGPASWPQRGAHRSGLDCRAPHVAHYWLGVSLDRSLQINPPRQNLPAGTVQGVVLKIFFPRAPLGGSWSKGSVPS